jgi:crotonobetainyl-CoA:carnitine CoA-transferase CaiB-like acyl-CoA transferase
MKVLDLSCDVAGRFAAKLFADAGDDVLRVGSLPAGDDPLAAYLDVGKQSVDAASLPDLLQVCELVFTSFDRGDWLGHAKGLVAPESCVRVTTSSYGTTGTYASWRGGSMADWAAGGYLFITGDPDREPLAGPENLCAYAAGYTAAAAAEAALIDLQRTGRGRHLDISTMESMLLLHQSTFSRTAAGALRRRTGRYTEVYPLTVLPCRDGHVSIGVVSDAEFDKLAIAIDRPDLAVDPRFSDRDARRENCDALDAELDRYLRTRDANQIVETLQLGGVACASVVGPVGAARNPQLLHRGFWKEVAGGGLMPGDPLKHFHSFTPTGDREGAALGEPGRLPLEGVRVLDFTIFWAGPSATRTLADLGADVIWVERPGGRLDCHVDDGAAPSPLELQFHLHDTKMFRGKRSIALDLEKPDDRAIAHTLARQAHIAVENFRPGVAARLGIGAQELARINPALTYVSLSGWGSQGPWANWRSYGPSIEAASSIEGRTGYVCGDPLRLGHTLPDGVGGLVGALASLRGLRHSIRAGLGGWYDISQLEAYAALAGEGIVTATRAGCDPDRAGNRSSCGTLQGVFPCSGTDQWIALRLVDAADCAAFARVSGISVEIGDNWERAEQSITDFARQHEKSSLATELQEAGIEAFAVMDANDLTDNQHLRSRAYFLDIVAGAKSYRMPGTPFVATPPMANAARPAPRPNEHADEIRDSCRLQVA